MKLIKDKKGLEWRELILWLILIMVIVLVVLGVMALKGKGINLIDKLEEILRFGR